MDRSRIDHVNDRGELSRDRPHRARRDIATRLVPGELREHGACDALRACHWPGNYNMTLTVMCNASGCNRGAAIRRVTAGVGRAHDRAPSGPHGD
jgi:hypothetical protein